MSFEPVVTLALISVCLSTYFEHPGMAASHSTRRGRVSEHNGAPAAQMQGPWYSANNLPSMCLSLLDQAERRRQPGTESRHNTASQRARSPKSRGAAGIVGTCVLVYGRARLGDRGGSNAAMPTGVMV